MVRWSEVVKGEDVSTAKELREQIAALVRRYYQAQFSDRAFNPETDLVHYAGRVFDADELCNLVDASLDFFLTANRYADRFEAEFADYLGVSDALLVNSGSSANLVALTTLTSPKLGERRLQPGDEVVTVAAAFPTTVAPDPPEQPGAGVRRRQPRRLHGQSRPAARGHRPEDARHHDGAHARRAVRPRRRRRAREAARPVGHRGQLRRAGLALSRPADRHVRPPGDDVVLSRASHHDGRRRLRRDQRRAARRASRGRSATGAATATAPAARTTPAARASASSSARCRAATITSTSTATSATT